uniref:Wsv526 n=1 Tax=Caenorhabditis tropicalis TaxID=1561998 RepID=A0A1I7TAE6_9PELO
MSVKEEPEEELKPDISSKEEVPKDPRGRKRKVLEESEQKPDISSEETPLPERNGDVFEKTLRKTPHGDVYATVIPSEVKRFFEKTKIIELVTNEESQEKIRQLGLLLSAPPPLPPLITGTGCFVFFIDGSKCDNAAALSSDKLRPWSANKLNPHAYTIKPNVRRHPIAFFNGMFRVVTRESCMAQFYLTEYSARLPREERLRKKVFYMTRNNKTFGNVLIVYNYVSEGKAPFPIAPMRLFPKKEMREVVKEEVLVEVSDIHGYDEEFGDFLSKNAAETTGYYAEPRRTTSQHIYLTVYDKEKVTKISNVLEWIVNSDNVHKKAIVNRTMPRHPPLITNDRAYVFFVNGSVVDPLDILRDDFSPWCTTGPTDDGVNYRTKLRKYGVECQNGNFKHAIGIDPKICAYNLISYFSINPKYPRLTKRIFYLSQAETIVGFVMIFYDYISHGPIPLANQFKRNVPWMGRSQNGGSSTEGFRESTESSSTKSCRESTESSREPTESYRESYKESSKGSSTEGCRESSEGSSTESCRESSKGSSTESCRESAESSSTEGSKKSTESSKESRKKPFIPENKIDSRAERYMTPRALRKVLEKYIIEELREGVDWTLFDKDNVINKCRSTADHFANPPEMVDGQVNLLKEFLKNNKKLRMYEPALGLRCHLSCYSAFTTANKYFNFNDLDPYNHAVTLYKSKDKKYYWTKHDFLVRMQSDMFEAFSQCYPNKIKMPPKEVYQYIALFLKQIEKALGEKLEYICFEEYKEDLDNIKLKMKESRESVKTTINNPGEEEHDYCVKYQDSEKISRCIKSFYPIHFDEKLREEFITSFIKETITKKNDDWTSRNLLVCKKVTKYLTDVMNTYPHIFKPYPKSHDVTLFESENKKNYSTKQAFLEKLQSDMLEEFRECFPTTENGMPPNELYQYIELFLKQIEKALGEKLEYICVEKYKEDLENIKSKMKEYKEYVGTAINNPGEEELDYCFKYQDSEKISRCIKSFYPAHFDEKILEEFITGFMEESMSKKDDVWTFINLIVCKTITKFLTDVMNTYPHIFKPYSKSTARNPLVLRVFIFLERKHWILNELIEVLNQKNETNKSMKGPDNFALTQEINKDLKEYGEDVLDGIDLIYSTISRGEHTKPIRFVSGGYGFASLMAFVEVMQRVIHGWKWFQRLNMRNAKERLAALETQILKIFTPKDNNHFTFIRQAAVNELVANLKEFCKEPAKEDVVEVPDDLGLKEAILKKDLIPISHKMISPNVFPLRDKHFELMYQQLNGTPEELTTWRICNVFHLLEEVQISCFVAQHETMKAFFRSQGHSSIIE